MEILSTGGSAKALRDAGVSVIEVSDFTGFPEILDGRVKTAGAADPWRDTGPPRFCRKHQAQMHAHNIAPIDLVAVNLYPFESTVARGAAFDDCVENIDIGGPALIRAAAKNHDFVTVLTAPEHLRQRFGRTRKPMAEPPLRPARCWRGVPMPVQVRMMPPSLTGLQGKNGEQYRATFTIAGKLKQRFALRRKSASICGRSIRLSRDSVSPPPNRCKARKLSYNNLNDTDAAYECLAEFDAPSVVIVKHANPCGVATGGRHI